ncbi:MAG: hypothetical protein H6733_17130 [Alphaproteobacteria bacterium]|nr:hypothetical protein [Alphaproteobacteria bacterium]
MRRWLWCALAVAACDDTKAPVAVDPTVAFTSHADPATVPADGSIAFTAQAADPDTPLPALDATWALDGGAVCTGSVVETDGAVRCTLTLAAGAHVLTVRVTDPEEHAAVATLSVEAVADGDTDDTDDTTDTVDTDVVETDLPPDAPTVSLSGPAAPRLYAGVTFDLTATLTDADGDVTALTLVWTSSLSGDDLGALATTPAEDGSLTTSAALDAGTRTLTLTATDADALSGVDAVTVEVLAANAPPTCAITAPVAGRVDPTLTLSGTAGDAVQPADTLVAAWSSDVDGALGTSPPDATGAVTLPGVSLTPGTHALTLTVTDEVGAVCTATVSVLADRPPALADVAPADGAVVVLGAPVDFAVTASDPDEPATALSVAWSSDVDGPFGTASPDATGAAGAQHTPSRATHTWTVTVTDTQGLTASATRTLVVDGPPDAPTVSITPPTPTTVDDLTATAGAAAIDADGDPVTTTVVWTSPGEADVTGLVLDAARTARGQVWTATATSSDGTQTASATASVTIANTAPGVATVSVQPDPALVTDALTCTADGLTDVDGDAVACAWSWTVQGLPFASTDAVLPAGTVPAHGDVACACTPDDGSDVGVALTSPTLTLSNTPPTRPGASLATPSAPGDALRCALAVTPTDADGDTLTATVAWTVDGQDVVGTTSVLDGDTIPGGTTAAGEVWSCTVTVDDGHGGTATSDPATVTVPEDPDAIVTWKADWNRVFAQRADGTWTCQGYNRDRACEVPDEPFLEVRGYERNACGRREDGTLRCWGRDPGPSPSLTVTDQWGMAAYGGCAITSTTSRVVCWGTDHPAQPFAFRNHSRIAVSGLFVCGLDDNVLSYANECLVNYSVYDVIENNVPTRSTIARTFYGGATAGCWLSDIGGGVRCWGTGDLVDDAPSGNYRAMDAYQHTACALRASDAAIACWGYDVGRAAWADPTGSWTSLTVGSAFGVGTDDQGEVRTFGIPRYLLDLPADTPVAELSMHRTGTACLIDDAGHAHCTPERIGNMTPPSFPRAGVHLSSVSYENPDSQWACWQSYVDGPVRCPGAPGAQEPPSSTLFLDWDTGPSFVCGVRTTGTLGCWGDSSTILTDIPSGSTFSRIACSASSCCAVDDADGSLQCWGPSSSYARVSQTANDFVDVAASEGHYCGQHADGTLTCWPGYSNSSLATPTEALDDIALGYDNNGCGLLDDGTLTCWGVAAADWAHGAAEGPYDRVWSDKGWGWCGRRSSDHTLACWGYWMR